jgi:tetratricopeptide (TPR) repeat protein
MKIGAVVLFALLVASCAVTPVAAPDARFFNDRLFAAASERIDARDVFALSAEMQRYVNDEIAARSRTKGRQRGLIDALYSKDELKLEYDTEMTRNAAQAFAARSGNCLSLVIMTAAFAKELGLTVEYQKVFVDDAWARAGDIYLSIGHVNLTLGKRKTDSGGFGYRVGVRPPESEGMMIDFLPPDDLHRVRTRAIGEEVIVAMYMNNRAVEALARHQLDDAYWWAREAVVQAPAFLTPYNTLGAIYQRHGNLKESELVLAHVLDREPDNIQAMSNLIVVLNSLGRAEESQRWSARLAKMDPDPPFGYFNRGLAAMRDGDVKAAKEAFAKEVARAPDYHEFNFWLAVAYLNLGEVEQARKYLTVAMKNSTTRRDHDLYAAKLDRINAARAN